jgi:hypothetical protein
VSTKMHHTSCKALTLQAKGYLGIRIEAHMHRNRVLILNPAKTRDDVDRHATEPVHYIVRKRPTIKVLSSGSPHLQCLELFRSSAARLYYPVSLNLPIDFHKIPEYGSTLPSQCNSFHTHLPCD